MAETAGARFDAVVVGGGPAGCTAAILLAQRGHRVALIERARHPRFHIGESLLPRTSSLLARLGVLEEVRALGVLKLGADFTSPDGRRREISFDRALAADPDAVFAFQVERSRFDELLLLRAAACGVVVFEGYLVRGLDLDDPGGVLVEARDASGTALRLSAGELVDCTGRDGLIARKLDLRRPDRRHRSAAVYGHFENVVGQTGRLAGNISVYIGSASWCWLIPLVRGRTSVGVVLATEELKARVGALDMLLAQQVAALPFAAARMRDARPAGPVHMASNYSYGSRRLFGRNWSLAGDAYAFVDPIFSSGVHFAMAGAALVADAVDARLCGRPEQHRLFRIATRRLVYALRTMTWLIHRFHDPSLQRLFMNPRNLFQVEQAVLAILAGDLFGRTPITGRFALFKLFYALDRRLIAPLAAASRPSPAAGLHASG